MHRLLLARQSMALAVDALAASMAATGIIRMHCTLLTRQSALVLKVGGSYGWQSIQK